MGLPRKHPELLRILGAVVLAGLLCAPAAMAQRNPLARFAPPAAELVNGRWNGVDLERRSNCAGEQNNGTRGTYAQFDVSTDGAGSFSIAQSGITGLNCSYSGRYETAGGQLAVAGAYSCTDGKQGDRAQQRRIRVDDQLADHVGVLRAAVLRARAARRR